MVSRHKMPLRVTAKTLDDSAHHALDTAERAGFRLMLVGRSAILTVATCAFAYGFSLYGNPSGLAVSLGSLVLDLLALQALGTSRERRWHRFALVGADVATLTLAALFLPLTMGGDVPHILVFSVGVGTHSDPEGWLVSS